MDARTREMEEREHHMRCNKDLTCLTGKQVLFLNERQNNGRHVFALEKDWKETPIYAKSLVYPVEASVTSKVGVALILEALGEGHLENDKYVVERMQLYGHPDMKIGVIMAECLRRLKSSKVEASKKYDRYTQPADSESTLKLEHRYGLFIQAGHHQMFNRPAEDLYIDRCVHEPRRNC